MICKWKCNLCNSEFKVNGLYKVDFINEVHLRDKHKAEYQQLQALQDKVRQAERELFDLGTRLFTEVE